MSSLPPYDEIDPEKTYSADEVSHILARKMARYQMDSLDRRVNTIEMDSNKGFSELKALIENLQETVRSSTYDLLKCRTDLKNEIYDEFVHNDTFKKEMTIMDGKIDKVDIKVSAQWKTITVAVVVAVTAIQIAFKVWGGQ